jgi:hypothetical protein
MKKLQLMNGNWSLKGEPVANGSETFPSQQAGKLFKLDAAD